MNKVFLLALFAGLVMSVFAVVDCAYQCNKIEQDCFTHGGHIKHYDCIRG